LEQRRYINSVILSFVITLLLIIAVVALAVIAYRIESTISVDPIIIFTLRNHMDGSFTYTVFNIKGDIDLGWLYELSQKSNEFQAFIPADIKAFAQLICGTIETSFQHIKNLI